MAVSVLEKGAGELGSEHRRPAVAWLPVLLVVAGKVALNLYASPRYGWHRDELYYRAAGQHLMAGYTDYPPIPALLARLADVVFGPSLVGLRLVASVAGAGLIVVTALMARELGGRRWAQLVAALAAAAPALGANAMFQTVSFDQLAWALVLLAMIGVLRDGTRRSWVLLGLAAGLGLEVKYTIAVLLGCLLLGCLTGPIGRRRLAGGGPWLAAAIALLCMAPNLWWQARHGWPSIGFFSGQNAGTRADYPPPKFVLEFLATTGFTGVVLLIIGGRALLRDRVLRPLGAAVVLVPVAFLALGGKGYYATPIVTVAFAAGAVALQDRVSLRWRRWLPAILVIGPLAFSPIILPVLPEHAMVRAGLLDVRDDYAAELGWPRVADDVASAWRSLPPGERSRAAVVAANYSQAGAVDLYGPRLGLPAAVSGHLSYRYWPPSPAEMRATTVVAVGFTPAWASAECDTSRVVARFDDPHAFDGEELGQTVRICRLRGTLADLWPRLAHDG